MTRFLILGALGSGALLLFGACRDTTAPAPARPALVCVDTVTLIVRTDRVDTIRPRTSCAAAHP